MELLFSPNTTVRSGKVLFCFGIRVRSSVLKLVTSFKVGDVT